MARRDRQKRPNLMRRLVRPSPGPSAAASELRPWWPPAWPRPEPPRASRAAWPARNAVDGGRCGILKCTAIDHACALRPHRSRMCGDDENSPRGPLEFSLPLIFFLPSESSFQSGGGFAPARSRLSPRLAAMGGDLWPGAGSFLKGAGPRNDRALGDASPVPERPASGGRRDARAWRPARPDSRCVHLQPCLAPRVAPQSARPRLAGLAYAVTRHCPGRRYTPFMSSTYARQDMPRAPSEEGNVQSTQ